MVITPVKIDELTYGYNLDGNGNLINNKLNHIDDPVSSLLCSYDIDDQSQDNYLYDAIGNLTKDNAEGIDNIEWNAYGKIKKIIRTFSSAEKSLEFVYDAQGNRVCKIVKPRYANMDGTKTRDEWDTYNSASWLYTFYVRDASGNIMTTYTKTGSEIENNVLKLDEVMLYGSSRIGTREVNTLLSGLTIPTTTFSRALGLKRYEVSNHLGNVLVTFTDRKYQIQSTGVVTGYGTYIASSQDYYPFGMIMNGRNWNTSGYRFGFNGQEKDNEIYGDGNATTALFWEYDPRIGRRWNLDPQPQESISDYTVLENSPLINIDILGDKVTTTVERYKKMKDGTEKKLSKFSLRRADRIEIKNVVSGMKIYDATKRVKKSVLDKAANEIQQEITDYWNTSPNKNGADENGYKTNSRGQKLKVTTVFEENIQVVDDPTTIKIDDHVIAIVSENNLNDGMTVYGGVGSNIMLATKVDLSGMDGSFAHEWGHVAGLDDIRLYRKGIEETHIMYNRVAVFNWFKYRPQLQRDNLSIGKMPHPHYNELKRAFRGHPNYHDFSEFIKRYKNR